MKGPWGPHHSSVLLFLVLDCDAENFIHGSPDVFVVRPLKFLFIFFQQTTKHTMCLGGKDCSVIWACSACEAALVGWSLPWILAVSRHLLKSKRRTDPCATARDKLRRPQFRLNGSGRRGLPLPGEAGEPGLGEKQWGVWEGGLQCCCREHQDSQDPTSSDDE